MKNPLTISSIDLSRYPSYFSDHQLSFVNAFKIICSFEQLKLCQQLELLHKSDQQNALGIAKALIDNNQLPVHSSDWDNLNNWVHELHDKYRLELDKQSIHPLNSDTERIQLFDKVASLSARLEIYSHAHDDMTDLLNSLKSLRNDWKHRKQDVENIVLSILSASKDYRVIKVSRSHLATLNLNINSIGKYYILFESNINEDHKKLMITRVAEDFSQVFHENSAQNMACMVSSYHRLFDRSEKNDIIADIQQFASKIYCNRPTSAILNYPTSLPVSKNQSLFCERRKSVLLVKHDDDPVLFNMAKPVFEPAEWDWPQILKYKKPRDIWSTSVSRLADHFTHVGLDYYTNMLNNARLMHAQRTQMFEFATYSLIKAHRALQLEKGLSNLSHTLSLISKFQEKPCL